MERREDPAVDAKIRMPHMRTLDGVLHPKCDPAEIVGVQHIVCTIVAGCTTVEGVAQVFRPAGLKSCATRNGTLLNRIRTLTLAQSKTGYPCDEWALGLRVGLPVEPI